MTTTDTRWRISPSCVEPVDGPTRDSVRTAPNRILSADDLEVAGHAVVRLPLHLLDDTDRLRLLAIHERRVEFLTSDRITPPLGENTPLRGSRLIQGAVWQAFDTHRLTLRRW